MDKLIEAFGIDWRILIAQLVNFAVLLFILYKIGYKPIMNFVKERTDEIEAGVKNAEKASKSLEEAEKQTEQIIASAHKEAQVIITDAKEQAKKQAQELTDHHRQELQRESDSAKSEIQAERDRVMQETKEQASTLVLAAAEKLLGEKMDESKDAEYVKKVLNDM